MDPLLATPSLNSPAQTPLLAQGTHTELMVGETILFLQLVVELFNAVAYFVELHLAYVRHCNAAQGSQLGLQLQHMRALYVVSLALALIPQLVWKEGRSQIESSCDSVFCALWK